MIILLMFVHIYFTFRLKFVQKNLFTGIKYSLFPEKTTDGIGTYKAFAAALGTTVGPGNIVGVAVAISVGGSGAVFWMMISGFFAMATKYAEGYLALVFKEKSGGTAVILKRLGHTRLAVLWCMFCALGGLFMGASVPSNSLAASTQIQGWIVGFCLAFLAALTVCFGYDGIANISAFAVPVMSFAFTTFCAIIMLKNISVLPSVISDMLKNAFDFHGALGAGAGIAFREGVRRGLYSNESGLGTGGVLAAESCDENTELSALASMTTTFWDTVVMCTVTGVMFLSCGAEKGMSPSLIMSVSFGTLPFGKNFSFVCMFVFVYATVIGWYYIAKRTLENCFEKTLFYDCIYISAIFFGAVCNLSFVWKTADIINFFLLVPSIYAIFRTENKIRLYTGK